MYDTWFYCRSFYRTFYPFIVYATKECNRYMAPTNGYPILGCLVYDESHMTVFSGSQGLHFDLPIGIFLDKLDNDSPP